MSYIINPNYRTYFIHTYLYKDMQMDGFEYDI